MGRIERGGKCFIGQRIASGVLSDQVGKAQRHLFERARRVADLTATEVDVQTYYAASFSAKL